MDMNSPIGKQILALVRKADYAHAGEEEAIDLIFKNISKDSYRMLLDIGCGRGGTADYVQRGGWGRVLGVDIDNESINYAMKKYPDVEFIAGDVMNLSQSLPRKFDIIYLFNVIYALQDHQKALEQFRKLSADSGQLIVFDYLRKTKNDKNFHFKEWNPIDLSVGRGLFEASGWRIDRTDDISDLYEKWYKVLVQRIDANSYKITALAGEKWFDFVHAFYAKILSAIQEDLLGGVVIYAKSKSGNIWKSMMT